MALYKHFKYIFLIVSENCCTSCVCGNPNLHYGNLFCQGTLPFLGVLYLRQNGFSTIKNLLDGISVEYFKHLRVFVGLYCTPCAIFVRTETLSHLRWEVLARVCLLDIFENPLEKFRCLQFSYLDAKIVSRETLQKPL